MSHICAGNSVNFVRNQWPGRLMARELPHDSPLTIEGWRKCPLTVAEIAFWATFTLSPNRDRHLTQYIFAYLGFADGTQAGAPSGLEAVFVHVQGFVRLIQVNSLGDWNGSAGTAHRAEQSFAVHGGNVEAVFAQQLKAFRSIISYAQQSLCPCKSDWLADSILINDKEILCRHRLFTAVNPQNKNLASMRSVITNEEDPEGRTKAVADEWRIVDRIRASRRCSSDNVHRMSFSDIDNGDFVEVGVRIAVEVRAALTGYPIIDLRLVPEFVHLIVPACDVPAALNCD
ncbi:hypothetical protein FA95DRAFT_1612564 [Auriscalpium vulgare]|uniref:Uncharacterized protein n=1 Tax=Auriscalpium vulgare TaxID=40419 RepID=A0ACB8R664_9AGAM|nr:hypothetical protein FA95DRAFT_1612564 [Auriscalpium vulgare]